MMPFVSGINKKEIMAKVMLTPSIENNVGIPGFPSNRNQLGDSAIAVCIIRSV